MTFDMLEYCLTVKDGKYHGGDLLAHLMGRKKHGGSSGAYYTLTGTLPLTLPHSLAAAIRSLIRTGSMTQTPAPTPDAPVYPTINGGVVQMVHRSGLPSGYKLLEYVGSSGAAYVLTDVYLASTDVVEAEFRNSSTTGYGALYGVFKLADSSALYANQTYYGYDESNNKVDTDIRVNTDWHSSRHDFVNGTLTIDDTTVTFTPFEFANSVQNAVLSRYYNNSYGYIWKGYIRKFKVTRSGEVICDLLPAKNSNDEAGLYDLISGNFYTATGGTLLEGSEVNDYEPAVVGTPETLSVDTQTASVVNLFAVGDYADSVDVVSGTVTRQVGCHVFDGTESFGSYTGNRLVYMMGDQWRNRSGCVCTHFPSARNSSDTTLNTVYASGVTQGSIDRLSIWFRTTDYTASTLKAFLAAQYAAGTPVIVWYPLATPTTESVTPQALRTQDGTTIVSSSAGSVGATVEYKASEEPASANALMMAAPSSGTEEPDDGGTDDGGAPADGSEEETEEEGSV